MTISSIDEIVEIVVGVFMDSLGVDAFDAMRALEQRAAEWDVPVERAATDILMGTRQIDTSREPLAPTAA